MQVKSSQRRYRLGVYLGRHAGSGGGISVYAQELLRNYVGFLEQEAAPPFEIIIYSELGFIDRDLEPRLQKLNISRRVLPRFAGRKGGVILDLFWLSLYARRDHLDLLHCVANYGCLAPGTAQLITVHDLYQAWPPEKNGAVRLSPFWYQALFRLQLPLASHIAVDAPQTAEEITKRLAIPAERITTVPLGLDSAFIEFRSELNNAAAFESEMKSWLAEKKITPGFVFLFGSSDPRKNFRRALRAWLALPAELRARGLVVKCNDEHALQILEEELPGTEPCREHVTVLPWLTRRELLKLYVSAGASLIPSIGEGFGFPALESVSVGCPVVTPDLDCLRSLETSAAHLCEPKNEASILAALTKALREEAPPGLARVPRSSVDSFHTMRQAAHDTLQLSLELIYRHTLQ